MVQIHPNAIGKRPLRTGYPALLTKWAWIKSASVCVRFSCKWQTSSFYLPLATLNAMFTTCNMAQRSPLVMQHTGNTWLYGFVSNWTCLCVTLLGALYWTYPLMARISAGSCRYVQKCQLQFNLKVISFLPLLQWKQVGKMYIVVKELKQFINVFVFFSGKYKFLAFKTRIN